MKNLPIEEYFTYHPTQTAERKVHHESINKLALEFATYVDEQLEDKETKRMFFFSLQQARMFANQCATIDELRRLAQ